MTLTVRPYQPADEAAVVARWEQCGLTRPWNDPVKDIRRKLRVQPDLFLVGVVGGEVVATAMAGYDGHRGWVYYLGVAPGHLRRGYGRELLAEVEGRLRALGCPKINLQVRTANAAAVEFYRSVGFMPDDVVSLGKRLEHDVGVPCC
jgi:ribosomal protein S18 acetylase RimI-like enzyme